MCMSTVYEYEGCYLAAMPGLIICLTSFQDKIYEDKCVKDLKSFEWDPCEYKIDYL